jgi:hypothetical protein
MKDSGIEVAEAEAEEMDFREWPVLWLVTGITVLALHAAPTIIESRAWNSAIVGLK